MKKKKAKAKAQAKAARIAKAHIVKHRELPDDKHLVDVRYEVHGPKEALPPLPSFKPEVSALPVEITKKAAAKTPAKHWHDFLTKGW